MLRPPHQIAVVGHLEVLYTVTELLVHVPKTGRDGHTHSDAEAHPVSLVGAVVGILTEDHNLHLQTYTTLIAIQQYVRLTAYIIILIDPGRKLISTLYS